MTSRLPASRGGDCVYAILACADEHRALLAQRQRARLGHLRVDLISNPGGSLMRSSGSCCASSRRGTQSADAEQRRDQQTASGCVRSGMSAPSSENAVICDVRICLPGELLRDRPPANGCEFLARLEFAARYQLIPANCGSAFAND